MHLLGTHCLLDRTDTAWRTMVADQSLYTPDSAADRLRMSIRTPADPLFYDMFATLKNRSTVPGVELSLPPDGSY
jgi:hypothetical protein